jgi:hypothetical protein
VEKKKKLKREEKERKDIGCFLHKGKREEEKEENACLL